MARDNPNIKSKPTLDAVLALRLTNWDSAHSGYLGNEKADTLAKRGDTKTDANLIKLPIPKVTWDVAIRLRERTKHNICTKCIIYSYYIHLTRCISRIEERNDGARAKSGAG